MFLSKETVLRSILIQSWVCNAWPELSPQIDSQLKNDQLFMEIYSLLKLKIAKSYIQFMRFLINGGRNSVRLHNCIQYPVYWLNKYFYKLVIWWLVISDLARLIDD